MRTPQEPPHSAAEALLARLSGAARGASAVAVGLAAGDHAATAATGTLTRGGQAPAGADTRFETGSLTKTFTGLLLAEMVARGEVRHDDPLVHHLPLATHFGAPDGHRVTLLDLATHTSGLPRNPPGLLTHALPRWFSDPWAGFGQEQLAAAVRRSRPVPGRRARYSTFGVALLGWALATAAGTAYPLLLAERVLRPLGLHRTDCGERPAGELPGTDHPGAGPAGDEQPTADHLGTDHPGTDRPGGQATGYWHRRRRPPATMAALTPAGALHSTARDLLTYTQALASAQAHLPVEAHTAPGTVAAGVPASLRAALADAVRPRPAVRAGDGETSLVWNVREPPGRARVYFHAGATRGCTAFAGFCPGARVAVTALTNTSHTLGATFVRQAYHALHDLAASRPTDGA